MGTASSTTSAQINTDIQTEAIASCPLIGQVNVMTISGADITVPEWCPPDSGIFVDQQNIIDSTCALSSLQEQAAKSVVNLSSDAQAKLGFVKSSDYAYIQTQMQSDTESACQNESTSNLVDINDVKFDACIIRFTQNASSNTACQIDQTQKMINDISLELAANAEGSGVTDLLFGNSITAIIIMIVVLIGIVIIAVIAIKVMGKKGGPDSETMQQLVETQIGGSRNFKIALVVLAVVALLIIMYLISRSSKKINITPNDIDNFKRNYNESVEIAGLQPQYNITNPYYSDISDKSDLVSDYVSDKPIYGYDDSGDDMQLNDFYKPLLY